MYKVGIIGHYGFGVNFIDGQTIKTKIITKGIENFCEEHSLKIDSHGGLKAIIPVMLGCIKCLLSCKNVVIMLTEN